jgi:hypothetical protein
VLISVVSRWSTLDGVRGGPVLGPRGAETGTLRDHATTLRRGQALSPSEHVRDDSMALKRCFATPVMDKILFSHCHFSFPHHRLPGLASGLEVPSLRHSLALPLYSLAFRPSQPSVYRHWTSFLDGAAQLSEKLLRARTYQGL